MRICRPLPALAFAPTAPFAPAVPFVPAAPFLPTAPFVPAVPFISAIAFGPAIPFVIERSFRSRLPLMWTALAIRLTCPALPSRPSSRTRLPLQSGHGTRVGRAPPLACAVSVRHDETEYM